MSEWWSYSPADFVMFSARTYYRLFEIQNRALWPGHILALLAGCVLVYALARGGSRRSFGAAGAILAAAWLFAGYAYFWERFATIHTGGRYFAAAFVVQGLLLAWLAAKKWNEPIFPCRGIQPWSGLAIAMLGVAAMPLAGVFLERPVVQAQLFGIAPDPTVAATFGLLVASRGWNWALWIVPLGWSMFSGTTLCALESADSPVLPLIAIGAIAVRACCTWRNRAQAATEVAGQT